jgi:hypothetical protein
MEAKEMTLDNLLPAVSPQPFTPLVSSQVRPLQRGLRGVNTSETHNLNGYTLAGVKSTNLASIAAGGTTTFTTTVTGAISSDYVVTTCDTDLQGMMLYSFVSSSNTVTTVVFNPTAGAIDMPSALYFHLLFCTSFTLSATHPTATFEDGVLTTLA